MKRGFQTKEEAEVWETEYKELCKKDMSKTFGEFYKNYESDIRPRVKESTWRAKKYVIKHKILLYFRDLPMNSMKDKNKYYYALEILYWCGLRTGEVLALTESDFDFVHHTVSITKSFQIINGAEVITKPKTINGIRTVTVPVSLCK